MSNRKPAPLIPPQNRKQCPVCGEPSYSAEGVHPQCAKRQTEAAVAPTPFEVWLRPLGDKFRLRVEAQSSARWLIAHLEALPGSKKCESVNWAPDGYTFNVRLTTNLTRMELLKTLSELSEVQLMPQPA
ncbi:MAG: hypothetical protein AB8G99_11145 [Planctomycetaceae bacterium]